MTTWRVIDTGLGSPQWNMAVDEAILEAVAKGLVPPTLRIYRWHPAGLSLGYFQPLADVDAAACRARGVVIVRRLTGGRAVLHDDEVTYSVVAPETMLPRGVIASYGYLSEGLLAAVQLLGAEVEWSAPGYTLKPGYGSAACFEAPSAYEIAWRGRKLIGSAQTRRQGTVLQHGSLPLSLDFDKLAGCLALPDEAREALTRRLRGRAAGLEQALGRRPQADEVAAAIVEGFRRGLGWSLQPGQLTPAETSRAALLARRKYEVLDRAAPAWKEESV